MLTPADITIVGLGPARLSLLSEESLRLLRTAPRLILRTARHPAAGELRDEGVSFGSLDHLYEQAESFDRLYPSLAEAVLKEAGDGPVVYAVPGHPLLGEESVRLLLGAAAEAGLRAQVLPAPSFVDVVAAALASTGVAPNLTEWQVADGAVLERVWWDPRRPALIFQIDDAAAASRVKLTLLEEYGEEQPVWIVRSVGDAEAQAVATVPLYQLDRPEAGSYDHLTTLYLPASQRKTGFPELVDVVVKLRAPDGCPWDREQTYKTLRRYVLEEAYEVLEAIDSEDPDTLSEELGDLLLQVVMLAQLGAEDGYFDIRDVSAQITEKLIRRHPHVFGDVSVENADEVLKNWDQIKRQEKPERTSALDGVPRELPALMKALEISKRAVKVGFEWPTLEAVLGKLDEEVGELKAELGTRDRERLRGELGDLLFTIVNVARWLKIDPEEALREMVERFGRRFREMERQVAAEGGTLQGMEITELDRRWDAAKAVTG